MAISVSLTTLPESEEQAAKAAESLARVAAGLAFDGMTVSLTITNFDDSDEEKESD